MEMDIKPSHHSKAPNPMLLTELGMVIDVNPLQEMKAPSPMLVTELGMIMDVKSLQPTKALSPMLVTLYDFPLYETFSGITTLPE